MMSRGPVNKFWDAGDWGTGDLLTMRYRSDRSASSRRAFTLVELMVVLIIMGVVAGLAMPRYTRSVAIAKERRALNNLYMIHAAEINYRKYNGVYWPPAGPLENLAAINANLVLNILADGDTYTCRFQPSPGSGFECVVTFDNGAYELTLIEDPIQEGVNPCCSDGACPLTAAC